MEGKLHIILYFRAVCIAFDRVINNTFFCRFSGIFFELFPFLLLGVIGGILGTIFIKCNIWWCRFRKTSKLGNYPVLEVVLVAVATALLAYPNEYTRMNTSELIYLLFSQCGVTNQQGICDYKDRNFTNVNHGVSIAEAGSGVNIHTIFKNLYGHRLQFFFLYYPEHMFISYQCNYYRFTQQCGSYH